MALYPIETDFDASWPVDARDLVGEAAARWARIITRPLSPVLIDGRQINGLRIALSIVPGNVGGQLARAGPLHLRPLSASVGSLLPATAALSIDEADFEALSGDGRLPSILAHEFGHSLGIGTVWSYKGLIAGAGTTNPQFEGPCAMREFGKLCDASPRVLPVEYRGGVGSADRHWRENEFGYELMSTYLPGRDNRLSRMTIASLEDIGYTVDYNCAEPYELGHADFTTKGLESFVPSYVMNPTEPEILPDDALM
jgi:hypothetical protein|tara:strand:- start:9674 stop:10438 length:765 start_codon:yes stop_codon:yes gene_type:complete